MSRLLSSLLIAAFAVLAPATASATASDKTAPVYSSGLTPQLLYQFLIAEIAGQRDQYGLAASAYVDLARSTRDPRIARRAAEVALHARQLDSALEAARIWNELEPDQPAARQLLVGVLATSNHIDELAVTLAKDLADAGPRLEPLLLSLNRMFGRLPDKRAVQRLIEQVTEPYVDHAEAHFARAQAAFNTGNPVRTRRAIDEALRLRPDWEMAAVFKAQAMGKGADLVEFLREFLAANPDANTARLAYARALVGEKKYEESREAFRRVLAAQPDNSDVIHAVAILSLQLDNPKDAEPLFRRLIELGKGDLNPPRFYLGQIAEQDERYDEALKYYDEIDGGEHRLPALLRGSQILVKQGKIDEARQHLRTGRDLLPEENSRLLIAEAQMLREAGRKQEAFELLLDGLKKDPDQTDLLYEIGLSAEQLDRIDDAERYLRHLIALKPESPQGYNALGYALADRGVRLEEAQQLIDKALSLAPDDPFILDSKGWILFRTGQNTQALDTLRRAHSLRPDPEIAAHIGEVLWTTGQHDEATTVWNDAIKAHPANAVLGATIKRFLP